MAVEIKDQPKTSYHDFDITESGYDMKEPYTVSKPVGAAAYVMVALCALIIITWLCNLVAGFIA